MNIKAAGIINTGNWMEDQLVNYLPVEIRVLKELVYYNRKLYTDIVNIRSHLESFMAIKI